MISEALPSRSIDGKGKKSEALVGKNSPPVCMPQLYSVVGKRRSDEM